MQKIILSYIVIYQNYGFSMHFLQSLMFIVFVRILLGTCGNALSDTTDAARSASTSCSRSLASVVVFSILQHMVNYTVEFSCVSPVFFYYKSSNDLYCLAANLCCLHHHMDSRNK